MIAQWLYRHYRGGIYEVIDCVICSSENQEFDGQTMILYKSIDHIYSPKHPIEYPDGTLFVRTIAEFQTILMIDGTPTPRFTYIDPNWNS